MTEEGSGRGDQATSRECLPRLGSGGINATWTIKPAHTTRLEGVGGLTLKKTATVKLRMTPRQKNRLEGLARLYADGNVSAWIIHCAVEGYRPKFLKGKKASGG